MKWVCADSQWRTPSDRGMGAHDSFSLASDAVVQERIWNFPMCHFTSRASQLWWYAGIFQTNKNITKLVLSRVNGFLLWRFLVDGGGHNSYSLWDDYPGLSRMIIVHYLWAGVSVQTVSVFPFYQLAMSICLAGEIEVFYLFPHRGGNKRYFLMSEIRQSIG